MSKAEPSDGPTPDRLADIARTAQRRAEEGARVPEPSLASRLGQIGILGWMIVLPALAGAAVGRAVDHRLGTGITITAMLLVLGISIGFWTGWRWMQRG